MDVKNGGKTKKGTPYYRFEMPEDEFRELSEEYQGLCIFCGEIADGVEPDARQYDCECCEKKGVYGAEELLIMGLIAFF